ncbi:hypothetical protein CGRA01v4_04645 [Colletotrichum graminicola]|nr:hypothetical protein CGRA01v4_04645 [Colletotrichum graminicola]
MRTLGPAQLTHTRPSPSSIPLLFSREQGARTFPPTGRQHSMRARVRKTCLSHTSYQTPKAPFRPSATLFIE